MPRKSHDTTTRASSDTKSSIIPCTDPVTTLLKDLAALILSFLDVPTLLDTAQFVSHAWRDAIDGGMPAIWHDVGFPGRLANAHVVDMCRKSRGHVLSLKFIFAPELKSHTLDTLRTLSSLRVLHIRCHPYDFTSMLSCFLLLEELNVRVIDGSSTLVFPSLKYLRTLSCSYCAVSGIHNLSALTKLELSRCATDANDMWPASVSDVTVSIFNPSSFPHLRDRIASLQQPIAISLDVQDLSFLIPPHNIVTALQRFEVRLMQPISLDFVGNMACLRELTVENGTATNQDLQYLSHLPNLQHQSICCVQGLTHDSLRHIAAIPSLTSLRLTATVDSGGVCDYSLIGLCRQLRKLVIDQLSHVLSLAEVKAITQLHQLEELWLCVKLDDPSHFALFCSLHSLRTLVIYHPSHITGTPMPHTAFSCLPLLGSLEELCAPPINAQDGSKLVDCLVQMPRLRRIRTTGLRMSAGDHEERRLRNALPRLETLITA